MESKLSTAGMIREVDGVWLRGLLSGRFLRGRVKGRLYTIILCVFNAPGMLGPQIVKAILTSTERLNSSSDTLCVAFFVSSFYMEPFVRYVKA